MSLIKGLHHAALRCCGKAEMDRVIEFYCNVLGMKRLRSWGEGVEAGYGEWRNRIVCQCRTGAQTGTG